MTARARYVAGLAAVAAAAMALSFVLPPEGDRRALRAALGLALVVQGPLGWWLVRTIGTARFLRVWATGIAARVALVGLTAFVLVRALGLPPEATLFSLVGLLVALLGVEAVAVLPGRSGPEVR